MQTIYVSLSELLRHFWSSFPPSTPLIEEKVDLIKQVFSLYLKNFLFSQKIHRVHETIERFRETQVNGFKEKVSTDLLTDFHVSIQRLFQNEIIELKVFVLYFSQRDIWKILLRLLTQNITNGLKHYQPQDEHDFRK